MPLYEYYCGRCDGVFEAIRPVGEASSPGGCPECGADAPRIPSAFNAFTVRDGYPRRIPDKGTFWHMGKEVKSRAKRMKGFEHPELAKPKPALRPTKGDVETQRDRAVVQTRGAAYRDRWAVDAEGVPP